MASAATQAKKRWNAGHYAQVKVSVAPELASSFKAACAAENISMASKLSMFMADYSGTAFRKDTDRPADYSTRNKRRAAVKRILQELALIKDAEECFIGNAPENLQGAPVYEAAEQYVSMLDEAAELLGSIY